MHFEPHRISELSLELLAPFGAIGTWIHLVDPFDVVESCWATGVNRKVRRELAPLSIDSPVPGMWVWREQADLFIQTRVELEYRFPEYRMLDARATSIAAVLVQSEGNALGVVEWSLGGEGYRAPSSPSLFLTVAVLIGELLAPLDDPQPDGLGRTDLNGFGATSVGSTQAVTTHTNTIGNRRRAWVADLSIDELGHEVRRDGNLVDLTPREFEVLLTLVHHQGQVLSKQQLLELIWGYGGYNDNVVEAQVSSLRRKLGPSGVVVETIRGYGYVIRRQSEIQGGHDGRASVGMTD